MTNRRFNPVALVLIGMAAALGVLVTLFLIDFRLSDLLWCVPALAVSALLIFRGAKKPKR